MHRCITVKLSPGKMINIWLIVFLLESKKTWWTGVIFIVGLKLVQQSFSER